MYMLQNSATIILASVLGLIMGSFVNIVIYRLPLMIERTQQYYSYILLKMPPSIPDDKFVNLIKPGSSCPHCQHKLRLLDNIPLISYLLLKGRCHFCQHKISPQYLIVELLSCILCGLCAYKFGASYKTLFGCIFTLGLIAAAAIDWQHMILPDEINLSGTWLGLILSVYGVFVSPHDAIIGAVLGYGALWGILWLFYAITKRSGLGGGDLKLFALFGAWFGWQSLQFIITLAALTGSLVGLILIVLKKQDAKKPIPFGPFLAFSAYTYLLY